MLLQLGRAGSARSGCPFPGSGLKSSPILVVRSCGRAKREPSDPRGAPSSHSSQVAWVTGVHTPSAKVGVLAKPEQGEKSEGLLLHLSGGDNAVPVATAEVGGGRGQQGKNITCHAPSFFKCWQLNQKLHKCWQSQAKHRTPWAANVQPLIYRARDGINNLALFLKHRPLSQNFPSSIVLSKSKKMVTQQ